jgi:hypothetical protein
VSSIKFVYIAGPYTASTQEEIDGNVRYADLVGRTVASMGFIPFVPHKMTQGWENDKRFFYDDFMGICLEWLKKCDAILYYAPSPGADRELEFAKENGIAVFFSIKELGQVANGSNSQ